jgi:uncharacterized protein with GYD domain
MSNRGLRSIYARAFQFTSLHPYTPCAAASPFSNSPKKAQAHIKESTSRAHAFDDLAAKSGVNVEGQFWTIGHYDGALVLSADHEAKILHLLASLAALGNVRTETLQAFTDKEFEAILKA